MQNKNKKKNLIIAGAISAGALILTATSISIAVVNKSKYIEQERTTSYKNYENERNDYYLTFGRLEGKFYNIQTNEFNKMIEENKKAQLELTKDSAIKWDEKNTFKSKFDNLKTLISTTLNDVETREVNKAGIDETKKAEIKANMKAYKDYFNSQLDQIKDKLDSEKKEIDFVKSKIENVNSKENYADIAYYQIKAFKLGKLWEKASEVIAKEDANTKNKSEAERKEFEKQSQKIKDLFSSKEAINNLKEIQEEVNKLIKNEDEKFKTRPEDEFAFKMDEFLAKEQEINLALNNEVEFKTKIAAINKSIEDNSIDKKVALEQKNAVENQIKTNLQKIENLTKEYEILLKELDECASKIKQFALYQNDFQFTLNAVDWIEDYFKKFKREYNSSLEYNAGLQELAENTNGYFAQIANIE